MQNSGSQLEMTKNIRNKKVVDIDELVYSFLEVTKLGFA